MTTSTTPRTGDETRTGAARVARPGVPPQRTKAPVAPVLFLDPVTPSAPETDQRRAARDEDSLRPLRTPFTTDAR